jgi:signal transduction histidine kinase
MDPLEKLLAIAHDLKSPLLGIRRLSERLLESEDDLPEGVRRRLELIRDSAEEASTYLEDVNFSTTLAAIDTEDPPPEPVDVAEVAREVVDGLQTYAEGKSQTLHHTASPSADRTDYTVLGDSLQLREAMNNLVSNALKFSPSGSTVEVTLRRSDETVSFSVVDEGPGLTPSEQDRIFEPLSQAGPDPTDGEETTGIGLYIVNRIVEKHDGAVEVESEKGEGATFRLKLPAASSTPPSTMGVSFPEFKRSRQPSF